MLTISQNKPIFVAAVTFSDASFASLHTSVHFNLARQEMSKSNEFFITITDLGQSAKLH